MTLHYVDVQYKKSNNKKQNISCRAGVKCQSMTSCPSFQIERRNWKQLARGSKEYSTALENLKAKICNKKSAMVCCTG